LLGFFYQLPKIGYRLSQIFHMKKKRVGKKGDDSVGAAEEDHE